MRDFGVLKISNGNTIANSAYKPLWTMENLSEGIFVEINIYRVIGMVPVMCPALHVNVCRLIDDFTIVSLEIHVRIGCSV